MKPKYFFILILFLTVSISYWIKCQLGWDISESFSFSSYPPFKYLVKDKVIKDHNKIFLLKDSFEPGNIYNNWNKLWMKDKGKVESSYEYKSVDGSRCLMLKSDSENEWWYSHNMFIHVTKGDVFRYKVLVLHKGKDTEAHASIDAFDQNKKPVKYYYADAKSPVSDSWYRIENFFSIIDDATYIRFRLSGRGKGITLFDDVCFRREKLSKKVSLLK